MLVTNLNENIVERLLLEGNAQFFKGCLVILQISENLQQLVRQVINEISNNLACKDQLIPAIIGFNHITEPLIELQRLNLVGLTITVDCLF